MQRSKYNVTLFSGFLPENGRKKSRSCGFLDKITTKKQAERKFL
jgi:hypothetical protein